MRKHFGLNEIHNNNDNKDCVHNRIIFSSEFGKLKSIF